MQLNFDATTVVPNTAFENLAPGWYTATITDSEMKPASKPGAQYLEVTLEVIAPQAAAGRKLWDRLNLVNPNEVAVKIAYETLSAICHAVNVIQVQDSQQLHGMPLDVKVGLSKVTQEYPEPRNEIKGYRAVKGTGAAPGMAQQAAPQQAAPQQFQQAPVQQAPVQQPPVQQPPVQQAPVQQQWQQAPVQQAPVQQAPAQQPPVQQAAPVQQAPAEQQPSWANAQPDQQAPQQAAQQAPVVDPNAPQQIETAQQAPTDAPAQQAAATNQPPWAQQQQ